MGQIMSLYDEVFNKIHQRDIPIYQSKLLIEAVKAYCRSRVGSIEKEHLDGIVVEYDVISHTRFARLQTNVNPPKLEVFATKRLAKYLVGQYETIQYNEEVKDDVNDVRIIIDLTDAIPSKLLLTIINASYEIRLRLYEEIYLSMLSIIDHEEVTLEKINQLIELCGLQTSGIELVKGLKSSLRLKARRVTYRELSNFDSRFGNNPYMPEHLDYPEYDGKPMAFLAQINLDQLPQFDQRQMLPDRGILYFFSVYGWEDNIPWDDHNIREFSRVIYFDGDISQLRRKFPSTFIHKYPETTIEFQPQLTLPDFDRDFTDLFPFHLDEIALETYEYLPWMLRFLHSDYFMNDSQHQMLGHPIYEQYPIHKVDEVLLLQIGTETHRDSTQFQWGDGGRIYFFINVDDLKNRNFDNVRSAFDTA